VTTASRFAATYAAAAALVGGACGAASSTSEPAPSASTAATASSGSSTAENSEWEKIVPDGDCQCADGSSFAFWVREADPTKVVFYLDGGGACWDATSCAFTSAESTTYDWNLAGEDPAQEGGIFDLSNPDNPFAAYTFVFVPYCTGDVHLGDITREYSPELTVEHNGFVNGTTALAYVTENYPDADQVVVVGLSAGSAAAPVYAGLVSDALPDAHVAVLADSSGAYPDDPALNVEILGQWGTFETMPDWEVNAGLTAREWSIPRFWIQAGVHDPDIVLARFDHAYDEVQTLFMELAGLDPSNLVASIDANEAAIEDAGVLQHSYTAPGHNHGIVVGDEFYEMEVNGVTLVDWVEAVLTGEPFPDVHCDDCATP
jgi:Pectinacetylesterase